MKNKTRKKAAQISVPSVVALKRSKNSAYEERHKATRTKNAWSIRRFWWLLQSIGQRTTSNNKDAFFAFGPYPHSSQSSRVAQRSPVGADDPRRLHHFLNCFTSSSSLHSSSFSDTLPQCDRRRKKASTINSLSGIHTIQQETQLEGTWEFQW